MALINNTDTSVLPYNDDDMVYDITEQLYVPTEKGILDYTGYSINLLSGSDKIGEINRYRIARDVKNYIRRWSKLKTFQYKEYQIAKDDEIREAFKTALLEQALYYIESGAGGLKTQHGINIANSKVINLDDLRGRVLVPPNTESILMSLGLLFTGYLRTPYGYEDDGTW